MTAKIALQLALKPRSYSLGAQVEFALQYPAFVGMVGEEVFAGAGLYPDRDGKWRAWAIIPAIGFRHLRWVHREMQKFLEHFDRSVRAAVEVQDGAGYVFATSLGFTKVLGKEHNAGRYFVLLERSA